MDLQNQSMSSRSERSQISLYHEALRIALHLVRGALWHCVNSDLIMTVDMMVQFIDKKLVEKSRHHREALSRLEAECKEQPLSDHVVLLNGTPQIKAMNTILQDIDTSAEDFIFYFDRLAALVLEQ